MKTNYLLDEYNCFSSNDSNTKHKLYFDENLHTPATLIQNSVFPLKIIDNFGDGGILAILFSKLSGGPDIQKKIEGCIYDFLRNCDKAFELKEPITEIFQIKYFCQALFHAKIYANASYSQKYSNMSDLSDFKGENNISKMKDRRFELWTTKINLDKQLTEHRNQMTKTQSKNNLHKSIKSLMIYIQHFRKLQQR